jgi:hypothetical protein
LARSYWSPIKREIVEEKEVEESSALEEDGLDEFIDVDDSLYDDDDSGDLELDLDDD